MLMKHKHPYLVTSKIKGTFWVFNSNTHAKKILDLRNISNLVSLDCYTGHFEIKRFRGRTSEIYHARETGVDENCLADLILNKYESVGFNKVNLIYNQEFENIIEYFKDNNLKINYGCVIAGY